MNCKVCLLLHPPATQIPQIPPQRHQCCVLLMDSSWGILCISQQTCVFYVKHVHIDLLFAPMASCPMSVAPSPCFTLTVSGPHLPGKHRLSLWPSCTASPCQAGLWTLSAEPSCCLMGSLQPLLGTRVLTAPPCPEMWIECCPGWRDSVGLDDVWMFLPIYCNSRLACDCFLVRYYYL